MTSLIIIASIVVIGGGALAFYFVRKAGKEAARIERRRKIYRNEDVEESLTGLK